jgi:hypothetical protein
MRHIEPHAHPNGKRNSGNSVLNLRKAHPVLAIATNSAHFRMPMRSSLG